MLESVRDCNSENICNYKEIYLKVSKNTLINRDQKGLYSGIVGEDQKDVVGIHVEVEETKQPDLILENNGESIPEELVEQIWKGCYI